MKKTMIYKRKMGEFLYIAYLEVNSKKPHRETNRPAIIIYDTIEKKEIFRIFAIDGNLSYQNEIPTLFFELPLRFKIKNNSGTRYSNNDNVPYGSLFWFFNRLLSQKIISKEMVYTIMEMIATRPENVNYLNPYSNLYFIPISNIQLFMDGKDPKNKKDENYFMDLFYDDNNVLSNSILMVQRPLYKLAKATIATDLSFVNLLRTVTFNTGRDYEEVLSIFRIHKRVGIEKKENIQNLSRSGEKFFIWENTTVQKIENEEILKLNNFELFQSYYDMYPMETLKVLINLKSKYLLYSVDDLINHFGYYLGKQEVIIDIDCPKKNITVNEKIKYWNNGDIIISKDIEEKLNYNRANTSHSEDMENKVYRQIYDDTTINSFYMRDLNEAGYIKTSKIRIPSEYNMDEEIYLYKYIIMRDMDNKRKIGYHREDGPAIVKKIFYETDPLNESMDESVIKKADITIEYCLNGGNMSFYDWSLNIKNTSKKDKINFGIKN